METWTVSKTLDWTTDFFKKNNAEWPHLEAEILLAHALKAKRIQLYIQHEKVLTKDELNCFKALIKRRSIHEPIGYITENQPFMGLDYYVDKNVLIPRPETEKLVEVTIDVLSSQADLLIADIGTGSGCIAISLAKFLPEIKVFGVDLSPAAIEIAKRNAEANKVADRCQFIVGDMFDPLEEKVNIIISNPPYIPSSDIDTLDITVKDWEPRQALDGGNDGLDHIKKLIEKAPNHLIANGQLLFEFGINQTDKIMELAKDKFENIRIIKDNSGIERFFCGVSTHPAPNL